MKTSKSSIIRFAILFSILTLLVVVSGIVGSKYFAVSTSESFAKPKAYNNCQALEIRGSTCGDVPIVLQRKNITPSTPVYSTDPNPSGARLVLGPRIPGTNTFQVLWGTNSTRILGTASIDGDRGIALFTQSGRSGGNELRINQLILVR